MKIGKAGLDLIKEFETFKANAYPDPGSRDGTPWTIGWGTTTIDGKPVKKGMTITEEKAEIELLIDLKEAQDAVNKLVKVPLTQNQFDALVSFTYNLGGGALQKSTLLRKLNKNDKVGAAAEFPKWVFNDEIVMPGLIRRRKAERKLFES